MESNMRHVTAREWVELFPRFLTKPKIYRLVPVVGNGKEVLRWADASDLDSAIKELKGWAKENGYTIAQSEGDKNADCLIEELESVD